MQSEQSQSQPAQPVQPSATDDNAVASDAVIQGDQVAGDKIEGDSIVANLDHVSGSTVIIGKNIHSAPGAPAGDEAAPATAGEGVSVRIDNSTLTGSSINIQQGHAEKTAFSTFNQSKTVQPAAAGVQLTQSEGNIRRLYRILIELEDSHLFSTDALERAALQTQIEQQVQTLRTVLPPYLAQARKITWLIPPDIQAACDRSGVD